MYGSTLLASLLIFMHACTHLHRTSLCLSASFHLYTYLFPQATTHLCLSLAWAAACLDPSPGFWAGLGSRLRLEIWWA